MATKTMRYDHPAYTTRHSSQINLPAGTADTIAAKFVAFTAMKVKSITGNVNVAGTDTTAAYIVYHGTDSVADITMSTSAAATALSNPLSADITLAADEYITFHRIASEGGTMAASIQVEWEIVPRSTITA
jgi:hypothetical protein